MALQERFPVPLVKALLNLSTAGGRQEVRRNDLLALGNSDTAQIDGLLAELVQSGWFEPEEVALCPVPSCRTPWPAVEPADGRCEGCHGDLVDLGDPIRETVFLHIAPVPRPVDWVLTLHGMNTRGVWQENLNWLVSLTYGRMVPVRVYKYGMVRLGVLFRRSQRKLRDEVSERLRSFSTQAELAGYRPEPDVIAHSFGTWLLGRALEADKTLKVGRVILTGCILPPCFCWQTLIDRGQVEAVLNHYGTADLPVAITRYFIPDSGPAGRRGFDAQGAINVEAPGFGHSTFFDEELDQVFEKVWRPFLTAGDLEKLQLPKIRRSRPSRGS